MDKPLLVLIDFAKDGLFAHAKSDVSSRLIAANWNVGMVDPYQEIAPPSQARIQLDNSDGAFTPTDSGADYYGLFKRGLLVKIYYGGTAPAVLFIGKIRQMSFDVGKYGRQELIITASDLMYEIQEAEFAPPLLVNVTTDEALKVLFEEPVTALSYASDYWILGVTGASELDTETRLLPTASNTYSFETGFSTIPFIGDNSGNEKGTSAISYIKDVMSAEGGGFFFFDPESGNRGRFRFLNRQDYYAFAGAGHPVGTADFHDAQYSWLDNIYNKITVNYYPRKVGAPNTILWQLDEEVTISPGETRQFTARYRDPNDESVKVSAFDVIPPARHVSYIAVDKGGYDRSHYTFLSLESTARSSVISITNDYNRDLTVTTLIIRGTPLYSFEREQVTVVNGESIRDNDVQEMTVDAKGISDGTFAQNYAGALLRRYNAGLPRLKQVKRYFEAVSDLRNYDLFDSLYITIPDGADAAAYLIVGSRHSVKGNINGGITRTNSGIHEVTFILRDKFDYEFWLLIEPHPLGNPFSLLGESTYLAF